MRLGAHIGISRGASPRPCRPGPSIGCESLQIFSKSPQMWAGSADRARARRPHSARRWPRRGCSATAVHHGYLINLGEPEARDARPLADGVPRRDPRAELLGVDGLDLPPGRPSRLGPRGRDSRTIVGEPARRARGASRRGRSVSSSRTPPARGPRSAPRSRSSECVLDGVDAPDRVGVTLDTCHLFAAGSDFRHRRATGD